MTTSPLTTAVDAAALADELTRARVVTREALDRQLAEFSGGGPVELAAFLVGRGVLTRFQADRVLAGEAESLVVGPYRLTGILRRGTLGPVYRAEKGGAAFAVRVLPLRSLWQAKQARQLARTLSTLPKIPALSALVDADSASGRHYLVWPHTPGETLADLVRIAGPFPPAEAAPLLARVAGALAACHARQVVHGLLTPHAVALDGDNAARLLDLGAGELFARNLAAAESLFDTLTDAVAGGELFAYAAPEWLAAPGDPTPAGDQYALGAVGYFALTGEVPTPDELRPVAEVNPAVPAALAAAIDRLLRPDPADRFTGMDEAHEVLVGLAGTPAAPAEPEPDAGLPSLSHNSASRAELSRHGGAVAWGPNGAVLGRPAERDDSDASIKFDLPAALPVPEPVTPRPPARPAGLIDTLTPVDTPPVPAPRPVTPPPGSPLLERAAPTPGRAPPPVLTAGALVADDASGVRRAAASRPTPPAGAAPTLPEKKSGNILWKTVRRKALFWRTATDEVQVSVFGPAAAAHSETAHLTVFLHPPGAAESVRTLARAFQYGAVLLGTAPLGVEVPRGERLAVHIAAAHLAVTTPMAAAVWQGQPHRLAFDLVVPWGAPVGPAPGVVSVGRGDVRVGKVEFTLPVLDGTG